MTALLMAGPAEAQQKIRGIAEVQYLKLSLLDPANDVEWWLATVQLDYSARFRKVYEFSSQFQLTDQKYVGRPDRQRLPLASLRLAHPLFGLFGSYRPIQVTDSRNITTSQQELNLAGYFQRAALPRLSASWNRRNQDASGQFPGSVAVRRNLMANYELGRLNLHAGYGDLAHEDRSAGGRRGGEENFNAGSSVRLENRRANTVLDYDYNQSRRQVDGARDATSRVHSASANGGLMFSARTSASLSYSFRNVATTQFLTSSQVEHDGTLSLLHRPHRTVQLSGGGGVRSVSIGDREETESFVMASASAEGNARPGWKLGASANQSWNWLPGDRVRPVQSIRSQTRMRLTNGLEAFGEASLSRTERPGVSADTIRSATLMTVQTAAGLRAVPLRSVTLNANLRRYSTGAALLGGAQASTTYTTSLDWRASEKLQLNGSWGRAGGFVRNAPDRSTLQAGVQWTPSRSFQASGTYTRTNQQLRDPGTTLMAGQEAYGAWFAAALTRDLRLTFRYTEADPGLPTRARQVSAALSQSLWR